MNNRASDSWLTNWERIRLRGMWRFVLYRGLLMFGVTTGIMAHLTEIYFYEIPFDLSRLLKRILFMGLFFGLTICAMN